MSQDVFCAFNQAATTYDSHAFIQEAIARQLIADTADQKPQTILDIGCGTGIASAQAAALWPQAALTALDAAPAMLAQTRAKVPGIHTIEADAARLTLSARFDLIVSSMMLHWLPDPAQALASWQRHLTPNGMLSVAVPIAGSLSEWKDLCSAYGMKDGLQLFPQDDFPHAAHQATLRMHCFRFANARDFLRSMKKTGAHKAHPGHQLASPDSLRRLLRESPKPFDITYRILYLKYITAPH